jgi:hypothetical protein
LPVRDTAAMIAGMAPVRRAGTYVFCATAHPEVSARLASKAFAVVREDEGDTLLLPAALAETEGFDTALPMTCLTLSVHSALEGVGLTAAVATALARAGIPCNVVAAYHHDHLFVPAGDAERALGVLEALAAG